MTYELWKNKSFNLQHTLSIRHLKASDDEEQLHCQDPAQRKWSMNTELKCHSRAKPQRLKRTDGTHS
jgi:hypothetical protein